MKPNHLVMEAPKRNEQCDEKMEMRSTAATESAVDNSLDYFDILPDELIIMIFRHIPLKEKAKQLTRCGMVCRRWQKIVLEESLWAHVDLAFQKIPLLNVARFIQRGIRTLDITRATIADPDPWRKCFPKKYKSKLKVLSLNSLKISKRGLTHLLKPCHSLVHLDSADNNLHRHTCEMIGNNAQLTYLTLSECEGLDAPGLTAILKGCQNLQFLNLNFTTLSTAAMTALVSNISPSVRSLILTECRSCEDQHIFDLVDRCPDLEFLDLSGNSNLTQAAIQKAHTLKDLQLIFDPAVFGEDSDYDVILDEYSDDDDDEDDFFDEEDIDGVLFGGGDLNDDFFDDGDLFWEDEEGDGLMLSADDANGGADGLSDSFSGRSFGGSDDTDDDRSSDSSEDSSCSDESEKREDSSSEDSHSDEDSSSNEDSDEDVDTRGDTEDSADHDTVSSLDETDDDTDEGSDGSD